MYFLTHYMIKETLFPMLVTAIATGYLVHRYYRRDNQARRDELKRIKEDVRLAQSLDELKNKLKFKNWP